MHHQPTNDCPQPTDATRDRTADPNQVEGAILALLLGEDHRLWSHHELRRYTSAEPLDVTDAVAELIANGLAHNLNGFILASRAARCFDRLDL